MAKVNAPLLSFGARGQIGNSMVFGTWRGIAYARQKVIPANPRTNAQQEVRGVFGLTSQMWTLMPADWKAVWNAFATGRPFTGRNRFQGDNVRMLTGDMDLADFVFSPGARGGLPPESIALTPGADQIAVELVNPSAPDGWTLTQAIAVAITDQAPDVAFTGQIAIDVEASTPTDLTITGLEASTDYVVGAWLQWEKPDGSVAYSVALSDSTTTTA